MYFGSLVHMGHHSSEAFNLLMARVNILLLLMQRTTHEEVIFVFLPDLMVGPTGALVTILSVVCCLSAISRYKN
jgi:hypothetical protein